MLHRISASSAMKIVCGIILILSTICVSECQLRSKECRQANPVGDPEDCHKFQYNPDTRRCVHLAGKLCAEGKNKFLTRQDCQQSCKSSKPKNQCDVLMASHACRTFAYDPHSDQCVTTPWSERRCFTGRSAFTNRELCGDCIRPRYCDAPMTFDPCHRWFWNEVAGRCGQTVESRCMSNRTSNRFDVKANCEAQCAKGGSMCQQARAVKALKALYYDDVANTCAPAPHGNTAVGGNGFINSPEGRNMCMKCIR